LARLLWLRLWRSGRLRVIDLPGNPAVIALVAVGTNLIVEALQEAATKLEARARVDEASRYMWSIWARGWGPRILAIVAPTVALLPVVLMDGVLGPEELDMLASAILAGAVAPLTHKAMRRYGTHRMRAK
jgi:hypothetical protein